MIRQVYNLSDKLLLDCYYIVSYFMGDAQNFYYSIKDKVNSGQSVMFVHENAGCINGFVTGHIDGQIAHVDNLYIDAKVQGTGVGTALLRTYENYAKAQNVKNFSLMSRNTARAIKFYEKQGYVRLGMSNKMTKSL